MHRQVNEILFEIVVVYNERVCYNKKNPNWEKNGYE
jgi:hypothetical protein